MYGYIYKITNNVNNKAYIGKHKFSGNSIDYNYWGSSPLLENAIKKYGKENFNYEIIEWCDSKETLSKREFEIIESLNCVNDDMFYNLHPGGDGGSSPGWHKPPVSEETRQKLRESKYGNKSNTGKHWFNNGIEEVESFECPEGYKKGRLHEIANKGSIWITNGIKNRYIKKNEIIPDGWYKGCIQKRKSRRNV